MSVRTLLGPVIAGLLFVTTVTSAQVTSLYPTDTWAQPQAQDVVVVDFDLDGMPDILAADYAGHAVHVRLAECPGVFAHDTTVVVPVGGPPAAIAVGDFDGDGAPDFATANDTAFSVTIVLGDGAGGTSTTTTIPVIGATYRYLAAAHLDGDADLDLVVGGPNGDRVAVLLNQGGANFAAPLVVAAPFAMHSMTVGDLDGDGAADVVTTHFASIITPISELAVFLNDGAGQLTPPTAIPVNQPTNVAIATFNPDSHADLVVAAEPATLVVFPGDGTGHFVGSVSFPRPAGAVIDLRAADLDGDGALDLVAATAGERRLEILTGSGIGSFSPTATIFAGPDAVAVETADVDLDGDLDLVAALGTGGVGCVRASSPGAFTGPLHVDLGMLDASFVRVARVDGDSFDDLVLAEGQSVRVYLADGAGGFVPQPEQHLPVPLGDIAVASIDADGTLDVLVTQPSAGAIALLSGNGSGGFLSVTSYPGPGAPELVALADIDLDGDVDAIATDSAAPTVLVYLWDFGFGYSAPSSVPVGGSVTSVDVTTVNGDTRPDIVVARSGLPSLGVLYGLGGGVFLPPASFPLPTAAAQTIALTDLDGDGDDDVVAASSDVIASMLTLPTGALVSAGDPLELVGVVLDDLVAAGDVDGDGHADVVGVSEGASAVAVLYGDGLGGFREARLHNCGGPARSVALGDLDGDALGPDIATVAPGSLTLSSRLDVHLPWLDLGNALAGQGLPHLTGAGPLEAGTLVSLCLRDAPPSSSSTFVLGIARVDLPFKGGVLVPSPDVIVPALPIDAAGELVLSFAWPAGLPSGASFFAQHWVVDAAGPVGFASSNGISGTTR